MSFDLETFRYFIENPSAWEEGFDQNISDQMALAVAEMEGLRKALLAACNYMEFATDNLGKQRAKNYMRAAGRYRAVAAGTLKFSDIED